MEVTFPLTPVDATGAVRLESHKPLPEPPRDRRLRTFSPPPLAVDGSFEVPRQVIGVRAPLFLAPRRLLPS
jgi:hypothetical protein